MSAPASPRLREVLRFLLYASPHIVLAIIGSIVYQHATEKDRTIAEQKRVIEELGKKLDRAWAEELVADLRVDKLVKDPETGAKRMQLTFVQYKPGTEEIAFQRSMDLPGEEVYIDALVVQFDRHFVDEGDDSRGKSLLLFRRAFGDKQQPVDGVPLFARGADSFIPEIARVDAAPSDFEKQIWARFWDYANDPKLAAAEGIRVAQGEAPHVKGMQGLVYMLTLRKSGGLQVTPRLPAAVVGGQGN
jgi:hypothetical protein